MIHFRKIPVSAKNKKYVSLKSTSNILGPPSNIFFSNSNYFVNGNT